MKRATIVMTIMIMITKNEMKEKEEIGIELIESELPLNSDLFPVVDS